MTNQLRQDYFDQVKGGLRDAIRRGAHLDGSSGWRGVGHGARKASAWRATRPHAGLSRRMGLVFAAIACTLAAAIVLITVSLGTEPQQAFAGWTAAPTTPAKGQKAAAVTRCRSMLGRLWRLEDRLNRSQIPPPGHFKAIAVDLRGPYTLSLLIDGDRQVSCFTGPRTSGNRLISAGFNYNPAPSPATDQINFAGGITTVGRLGKRPALTFAEGQVGVGVEGVTFLLADGRHIVTTTEKGWYLAWWPGRDRVTAAEVRTSSGTQTRRVRGL
jgi:hypothetical protein